MKTWPKSLAAFQQLVNERGQSLRSMSIEEIARVAEAPEERFVFDGRESTIGIIVQPQKDASHRVVVQGFMKAKILGKNVALDGFYKWPDGSITEMSAEEFYEFD